MLAHPARVLIHEVLLERVWKERGDPSYVFTKPRVGYRMPKGEGAGRGGGTVGPMRAKGRLQALYWPWRFGLRSIAVAVRSANSHPSSQTASRYTRIAPG